MKNLRYRTTRTKEDTGRETGHRAAAFASETTQIQTIWASSLPQQVRRASRAIGKLKLLPRSPSSDFHPKTQAVYPPIPTKASTNTPTLQQQTDSPKSTLQSPKSQTLETETSIPRQGRINNNFNDSTHRIYPPPKLSIRPPDRTSGVYQIPTPTTLSFMDQGSRQRWKRPAAA